MFLYIQSGFPQNISTFLFKNRCDRNEKKKGHLAQPLGPWALGPLGPGRSPLREVKLAAVRITMRWAAPTRRLEAARWGICRIPNS